MRAAEAGTGRTNGTAMRAILATALMATAVPGAVGPAQAQDEGSGLVLTATTGPRSSAWTRVFNPFRNDAETRWPASAGVYEPLMIYNRATASYMPWLAGGYEWSADARKLRLSVRKGVSRSDGVAFTARDVAFTFDLMRRFPELDLAGVWGFLSGVAAVDAQTVEFSFSRPHTPGLVFIGNQPIVPEHRWKDVEDPVAFDDPDPVGTGPFTEVRSSGPGQYEIGRNERYWQSGKPAVGVLRVPLYRSNDEIVAALKAGELDWASLFMPDIEGEWVAADPARHQYWYPDFGPTVLIYLNTQRKPFDDSDVRKALSMAVDRPRIMKEALRGYAPPADTSGLAESQKRWKSVALVESRDWTLHQVERANQLLDAAGLSRGSDGIRVVPGSGAMRYEIHVVKGWTDWIAAAEIIRENLDEVGVSVSVKPLGYNERIAVLERGRFDLGLWFGNRGPTPYQFYRGQMDGTLVRPVGEEALDNYHRFSSEEATAVLRRFERSSDEAEQVA